MSAHLSEVDVLNSEGSHSWPNSYLCPLSFSLRHCEQAPFLNLGHGPRGVSQNTWQHIVHPLFRNFNIVTECICTLRLCCMYSVSLCQCSFVCLSIFYVRVTCCDLDVTISETRGNNDLSYVTSKRKEIKSGIPGSGSFVIPYFQPATSTNHLQYNRGILIFHCCHGLEDKRD